MYNYRIGKKGGAGPAGQGAEEGEAEGEEKAMVMSGRVLELVLHDTGVARAVNELRNAFHADIAKRACALVAKWKASIDASHDRSKVYFIYQASECVLYGHHKMCGYSECGYSECGYYVDTMCGYMWILCVDTWN